LIGLGITGGMIAGTRGSIVGSILGFIIGTVLDKRLKEQKYMAEPEKVANQMSEEGKWPKVPEIEVKFEPYEHDNGSIGLIANPRVDLGILGVWDLGGEIWIRDMEDISLEEQIVEIKTEVQYAFSRLLLRIAAVALVKRGEGLAPIEAWYEHALKEHDTFKEEKVNG